MESKPHKAAVVMPINSLGETLFQQKDSGYPWNPNQWCFFGGKVKEGESPEEALRREIGEEIGEEPLLDNIDYFGDYLCTWKRTQHCNTLTLSIESDIPKRKL